MMKNYDHFRRQSIRLKDYDYSAPGYYFVTICTKNKANFFGKIDNGRIRLTEIGRIAKRYWLEIPKHYSLVRLAEFIVMPNHFHGILKLTAVATQNFASLRGLRHDNKFGPQSRNLSAIIRGYKIAVRKYAVCHDLEFFWQSRFYDRIIRDREELNRIRVYIKNNPNNWLNDRNFPENL